MAASAMHRGMGAWRGLLRSRAALRGSCRLGGAVGGALEALMVAGGSGSAAAWTDKAAVNGG